MSRQKFHRTFRVLQHTSSEVTSGGSRPSAQEGARLTMNVEFCEEFSETSKKMRYFRKNIVGAPPLDPPLVTVMAYENSLLHFSNFITVTSKDASCSMRKVTFFKVSKFFLAFYSRILLAFYTPNFQ